LSLMVVMNRKIASHCGRINDSSMIVAGGILYAPSERFALEHIVHLRELFTETIHWTLIETHLHDMLRVALSISQGKMRASTILRKLGTHSHKNKLYTAFCELGRVVRTIFLLRFVSDEEMRRTIHAATNTAEAWNGFVQWVAFGGEGVIRQNNREEQRKIIRYNHLVPEFEELRHTLGISTRTNKKNQGPLLPDCHKT
jgi:TnpA family transposase